MTEPVKISRIYTYDAENQLTSVTYENGTVVSYTYDKAANRLAVTSQGLPGQAAPVTGSMEGEQKDLSAEPVPVHAAEQQCRNCGTPLVPGNRFCSGCGAPVSPAAAEAPGAAPASQKPAVCPACGSPVKAGVRFCGDCGRRL
ncbi:MAG TPA: zinc-ribbon domain-containing protein [Methanoregula sp.]|nr:zinc-ribbon domain-containing protein [Methanoregula sp.]